MEWPIQFVPLVIQASTKHWLLLQAAWLNYTRNPNPNLNDACSLRKNGRQRQCLEFVCHLFSSPRTVLSDKLSQSQAFLPVLIKMKDRNKNLEDLGLKLSTSMRCRIQGRRSYATKEEANQSNKVATSTPPTRAFVPPPLTC